ncbi:ABC transporter ATP-binding protein [Xylophilus sp. GOD-11R]|uniref:ABC transporter ATP-binding protein n=1 Tax=Xylophilus sp. GOD-11R TaxID=3089814 RepID=UPI00298BF23F|nr:ABC transporter ATP-binding protein [Xylophilus sp. GOD-11R]WPB56713.1 ABC transporter ATP-binding protein [Xylophilus sp. GOD-11R]
MELTLERVGKVVGAQTWLRDIDLALKPGAVTVLLGVTQAGKTSLMRLMAGLDAPTSGQVRVDGRDVTGVPVRERNVSMVYQQFINYPSFKVFDNIASPLKLRGEKDVTARVKALADRLHIGQFLDRYPSELSGGQQQRVALARALAKGAPLMLLDEPLVNLDYKLREGLREELSQLFAAGDSTVVYATTEPAEALLLGGYTAVMEKGEVLQYGPTAEVFHQPASLRVARAFSDPPMNLLRGQAYEGRLTLKGGLVLALPAPMAAVTGPLTLGVRAAALRTTARPGDTALAGTVQLTEISGSDTFVHLGIAAGDMVAQFTGVHHFSLGEPLTLYLHPSHVYLFDGDGGLLAAPERSLLAGVH